MVAMYLGNQLINLNWTIPISAEADMIMQNEPDLLEWPCGLPSVSSIDQARVDEEMEKKLHPAAQ